MNYILETIAFTIESCHQAQAAGVHRVELCDNPAEGGTTPSYGFIQAARKVLDIPLYPMIRPRGGNFLYSDDEFVCMKNDIKVCKNLGCDGVVLGILLKNATINKEQCSQLVHLAYPMGVTFHRAFDRVLDAPKALKDAIDMGCERILTSGQYPTALEGMAKLKTLVELAQGQIIIMPGSGVRANNILQLAKGTGAVEFHSSAQKKYPSLMEQHNPLFIENLQTTGIDVDEVTNMLDSLQNIDNMLKQ